MMTREQAAANHRRLVAIHDRAMPDTAERLCAKVNVHMSRWTLNCNGFTPDEIAVLERPRRIELPTPEDLRRISGMISPKFRRFILNGLTKTAGSKK